jgi:hypothetical protein
MSRVVVFSERSTEHPDGVNSNADWLVNKTSRTANIANGGFEAKSMELES